MSDSAKKDTSKRYKPAKIRSGGGPGGGIRAPGDKPRDLKRAIKKLLHYIGGYKFGVAVVAIFAIASTVFSIIGPKILGEATTKVFEGVLAMISDTGTGIDFMAIGQIMLLLVFLYVVSAIFSFIQGFIMAGVANKISYRLRRDIDEKILRLPLSYFDRVSSGDVMSRITNDVDAINQSLNQSLTQIITSATTLIGILVMMFTISWQMAIIAIITLPLSMLVASLVIKRSQPHFFNQQNYLGEVNGLVEEMYGAHQVVKAFNREQSTLEEFEKSNASLFGAAWRANFLSGMMMPIMNIIGNFGYVVVCILGGYLAINGNLPIGDIQAFIQYMRSFQQPIMALSQISNVIQQTMAAAERVFDFLAEEEETQEASGDVKVEDLVTSIDFEHVKFGYTADKPVIKDFNAHVNPGQKIAIVGPTGAGKTTLVKLLMRFYDIDSGDIRIGEHTIYSIPRHTERSIFGIVLQDTWLYRASIRENIRYGRLDATDEEVCEAARIAQVDKLISTLPHGYDMELNEEASNLSAGQKQLLTIARTVLADPRILILDEATSSVDTRTEQLIQRAMETLMQGRTSFIIAHRLSTIKNADLILVIDEGDIVEQGTHQKLLNSGGFYANLYAAQFTVSSSL